MNNTDSLLAAFRSDGWAVAAHNDYRIDGKLWTFWLLTKGNLCIKGEGRTDVDALLAAQFTLNHLPVGSS